MAGVILSPGVELAWQVAGDLALSHQDEFIEPKHLLFGICALEKVIEDGKTSLKNPGEELHVRTDVNRLQQLVGKYRSSSAMLRRAVRQTLSSGDGLSKEAQQPRVIGRSKIAKEVFDRAEQIARNAGFEELGVITLLQALLEISDPELERIIDPVQQEVGGMSSELRRITDRPAALNISLDPELRNLDEGAELRRIEIGETVDAKMSIPLRSGSPSSDKSTPVLPSLRV